MATSFCKIEKLFLKIPETVIPPHAVYEQDNSVVYTAERYEKEIIFDVVRRKGSTGTIQAIWDVTFQSAKQTSLVVSPMSGQLKFLEGQWNSSFHLQLVSVPQNGEGATMHVSFNNMSGGAMFGNFTSVKIVFPSVENTKESNFVLIVLSAVIGAIVLVVIVLVVIYLVIRHQRYKINIFCFQNVNVNVIAHLASTTLEYNLIHLLPFDGFVP